MKNKYVAAVLNFLFFGAGYLYLGKRKLFGSLLLLAVVLWLVVYFMEQELLNNIGLSLVSVIMGIAFAIDAYREAENPPRH